MKWKRQNCIFFVVAYRILFCFSYRKAFLCTVAMFFLFVFNVHLCASRCTSQGSFAFNVTNGKWPKVVFPGFGKFLWILEFYVVLTEWECLWFLQLKRYYALKVNYTEHLRYNRKQNKEMGIFFVSHLFSAVANL